MTKKAQKKKASVVVNLARTPVSSEVRKLARKLGRTEDEVLQMMRECEATLNDNYDSERRY